MDDIIVGADGRPRCGWAGATEIYLAYHDDEWGVPQHDDVRLFEKLCLEAFQSGLSWLTILRKRAAFRAAFAGFDPEHVVWEDDVWVLTHPGAPAGLPLVMMLHSREHLDLGTLDDEQASQLGRITSRLVRIIEALDNIGRTHVMRIGDGGSHLHVWFVSRTARLTHVLGSVAHEWDDILPAGPEDVWRADLHTVATKLANWGGDARA